MAITNTIIFDSCSTSKRYDYLNKQKHAEPDRYEPDRQKQRGPLLSALLYGLAPTPKRGDQGGEKQHGDDRLKTDIFNERGAKRIGQIRDQNQQQQNENKEEGET